MSDNTQKPRQFWIHATGMAYEFDVMSDSPTAHVIEYQAFQEVCRAATAEAEGNVLLQKKNQALEEKLAKAVEALELIEKTYCGCWDKCKCGSEKKNDIATAALKELK